MTLCLKLFSVRILYLKHSLVAFVAVYPSEQSN